MTCKRWRSLGMPPLPSNMNMKLSPWLWLLRLTPCLSTTSAWWNTLPSPTWPHIWNFCRWYHLYNSRCQSSRGNVETSLHASWSGNTLGSWIPTSGNLEIKRRTRARWIEVQYIFIWSNLSGVVVKVYWKAWSIRTSSFQGIRPSPKIWHYLRGTESGRRLIESSSWAQERKHWQRAYWKFWNLLVRSISHGTLIQLIAKEYGGISRLVLRYNHREAIGLYNRFFIMVHVAAEHSCFQYIDVSRVAQPSSLKLGDPNYWHSSSIFETSISVASWFRRTEKPAK